jgi:hypothetical protein
MAVRINPLLRPEESKLRLRLSSLRMLRLRMWPRNKDILFVYQISDWLVWAFQSAVIQDWSQTVDGKGERDNIILFRSQGCALADVMNSKFD